MELFTNILCYKIWKNMYYDSTNSFIGNIQDTGIRTRLSNLEFRDLHN